jgi:hypothetical protein
MLAILAGLTGCVVHTEPEPELEDGTVVVAWQVGAAGCEAAGVETVEVAVGDEASGSFACADEQATLEVPPGRYDLFLDGVDAQGAIRYGGDGSVTVGSGQSVNADTVVLGALPADLTVTWYFENGRLCSANGVSEVTITVFQDDYPVDTVVAPCDEGSAALDPLVAGTYDVSLLANDGAGGAFSGTETVDLGKGDAVMVEIQLLAD